MLACCAAIGFAILSVVAVAQFAAIVKFFPYNLSLTWAHYDFDQKGGGGWVSYWNSIRLGLLTAGVGTTVVFAGAYLTEKARGFAFGRALFHFLAMLPMAVPGMVLGLAYIFFFNAPANPLNALYRTMTILVLNTIVHFYTVGHLTALTALRQMDPEFETVSASLKQPFYRTFWRVTVPVCLPSTLDIAIYMFVNAMTTVSGVVFLYGPQTELASISVLNMDDTGEIASAAAMAMMIFYTCVAARVLHLALARGIERRTQAWRRR
jgi:iron(III) transport system permease protein